MTQQMIDFTPEKLARFKKAYKKAEKLKRYKQAYSAPEDSSDEVFTFDGNEFVLGYAKYLIEYLESQFGKEGSSGD